MKLERHKYKEYSFVPEIPDRISSIKYDGANYFLKIDAGGRPSFISRRPSVSGDHLDRTEKLPHLASLDYSKFPNHTFNVELIHTGFDKNAKEHHPAASGILNSLPPKAIQTQKDTGPIRAVVFDVIDHEGKYPTYSDKISAIRSLTEHAGNTDVLFHPEFTSDTEGLIEQTKKEGREGIITTSLSLPETKNPRYKVKHKSLFNLRIVKLNQEFDIYGNKKDSMGSATVVDATGKVVGDVGSGWTRDERIEAFKYPERYIGKLIQVEAMPSVKDKLRHPVYNGEADGDIDVWK